MDLGNKIAMARATKLKSLEWNEAKLNARTQHVVYTGRLFNAMGSRLPSLARIRQCLHHTAALDRQQGLREAITTMAHSLKNESLTHIETIDGGLFSPLPFLNHKLIRLAMFEHPNPPDVRSIARPTVFQYPDSLKLGSAGQKTEIGPIYMRNA
ncbi:hypothetical protein BJX68DRAFT_260800 [Aspergillus pseudodeflectus]|uniref:Uncharacterized protein n=1 Tax=Aspergillus pseudodeflectus TaxID=176178 RepID=A0ABR4LBV6_9EURO